MALRINHNITSLDAWRNLTQTTQFMQKSMEKLSSGFRINRAADDPAGLVISEQFRAQIAGLNRAVQNSEGSINMIQTAEGALTEINNLLVGMRELAIHAANEGFNDDNQLLADQAEITNAISTINRIAANTQFGTKKMLDGSADNVAAFTTGNSSRLTLKESNLAAGTHSIAGVKLTDPSGSFNVTTLGISAPTSVSNLSDGVHNVDIVQSSAGATKTGTAIEIKDAWNNGLRLAAAATSAQVSGTFAAATNSNGATATVTFELDYQDSIDGPIGVQYLTFNITADTENMAATMSARQIRAGLTTAIANNVNLAGKITVATTASGGIRLNTVSTGTQYSVKAVGMSTSGNITFSWNGSVVGDSGRGASLHNTLRLSAYLATMNGDFSSFSSSTISLGATTINTAAALLTIVGSALKHTFGTFHDSVGTQARIVAATVISGGETSLKMYTKDEGSRFYLNFSDSSTANARSGLALGIANDSVNVTGTDALVSLDGYINSIDEVRYYESTSYLKTKTLYDSADTTNRGSAIVTIDNAKTGGGINIGNILMSVDAATFSVRLDGGSAYSVTAGEWTTIFNSSQTESIKFKYDLRSLGGTEQLNVTDQALVFQIGANVGQTAKIGIQNMNTSYLGKDTIGNQFASLADVEVTSAAKASDAQEVIDAAIDEVSNLRGTLGSFQRNTLESNLTNLRISAQNLTAAESTIRDTDMAKEMSSFVRYQILLQAGTSMLAQGNQIPQVVLSLFR